MSSVKGQRDRILPPYTRRADDFQHRLSKTLAVSAMVLLAMMSGYLLAIFGGFGWFLPAIPLVLLIGIALWMAPDTRSDYNRPIAKLTYIYFAVMLMWPNYIAFNFPGFPWISFIRLLMFPLGMLGLYALATSSQTRHEVSDVLQSHKVLVRIFIAWVIWQALMLVVGGFQAVGNWVHQIFVYYFMFIIMAWLMVKPGRALIIHRLFITAAVVVSLVTLWEYHVGYTPWAYSVPSFLGMDPMVVERMQNVRLRTGEYRASSIFLTEVTYGEFFGIVLPFVLLGIMSAPKPWQKILGFMAYVLLFVAAVMNNSRTSMVGFLVVTTGFFALWVLRLYGRGLKRNDLFSTSIFLALPFIGILIATIILVSDRLRVRVLGGSEHAASNAGREAQWDMAIPVITRNPIGHGMGTVQQHVPYTNLAGDFTIDSYPINLLVEYGVPGFLLFVAFFVVAAYMGVRVFLRGETRDEEVAGAAALSIISFLITRTVMSSETGHIYVYPLAGLILAQWYMQKVRDGWKPSHVYRPSTRQVPGLAHGVVQRSAPPVSGRP